MTPTPAPATLPGHCKHECVCSPYRMIVGHTYGTDDYACVKQNCEHDTRRSRPASTAPTPNQHVCPHLEYRNDVGFCHYHDNPIQLNTMPEGTTCEDCQRFRKPECPYPDSNITMNKCKAFLINLKQHDAAIRQQVLDDICKNCGAKEYGTCVGTDCPCGSYESHIPREEQGS